jgi:predicted regulator of Ras-like GTPase activity (Roadblock/LC7/MglB family)
MESTTEHLDTILKEILKAIPKVKAAAFISTEGLPIASALPQGVDKTRMATIIASLSSLAERSIIEMRKGEFDQIIILWNKGYLIIMPTGPKLILIVYLTDIRGIFFECKRTSERIAKLI